MLKLNNFAEFLFKKLLEGESMSTLPIWFSDRFRRILEDIFDKTGNEVAQRLLYEEGKHGKKIFIDIDDDSIDKISFILSNKVEDVLGRTDNLRYLNDKDKEKIFNARQRSTMGISRFINELFNNEYKTQTLSDEQKEENKRYFILV
jgi:WD40 repeat protein